MTLNYKNCFLVSFFLLGLNYLICNSPFINPKITFTPNATILKTIPIADTAATPYIFALLDIKVIENPVRTCNININIPTLTTSIYIDKVGLKLLSFILI